MQYDNKSYCQYLIELHLILVVKYRKLLLVGHLGKFVKNSIVELSTKSENIFESKASDSSQRLKITGFSR